MSDLRKVPELFKRWQEIHQVTDEFRVLYHFVVKDRDEYARFLRELRDKNLAKALTEPKVTTLSGRPAFFLSGGEVAIPEVLSNGAVRMSYRPYGTQVDVLPVLLADDRINLEVQLELSTRDETNGVRIANCLVPGITAQRLRTTMLLDDGQTLVVGGLRQSQMRDCCLKVPVLAELPYVGSYFSVHQSREVEEETLLLVKATVVVQEQ